MALPPFWPESDVFEQIEMVRVATRSVSVYKEPNDQSQIVATWPRDSLLNVYETVNSGTPEYNPIWYRVFGGYMHRARLQRVRFHLNKPAESIPETKQLGEMTVPFVQPYRYTASDGWQPVPFRLYYSTIHWIMAIEEGPDHKPWYRLLDEADDNLQYHVPAAYMRLIPPEEIAPISPEVKNKWIDVNLREQSLTCYENDSPVYHATVSTGLRYLYDTPTGRFHIMVKLPSRRMNAADRAAGDDENVLAGVPWCSFFTDQGHAFHGTYWHDNFGMTMSHGCVNMVNEDAKWLFRWTRPVAAFEDIDKRTLAVQGYGTRVEIHY
jgi:hypothetical protein